MTRGTHTIPTSDLRRYAAHLNETTACIECGDEYREGDLQFGICDACDNRVNRLCGCGAYPGPGRRECRACAFEGRADERFHEIHEEGAM